MRYKGKKWIFIFGLCLFVMAGGCSPENEETVKKDTDINNVKKFTPTPTKVSDVIMKPTATPTPVLNNTPEIYFDEDKMEYLNTTIVLTEEQRTSLKGNFDIDVDYKYSEYFEIEEAFEKYATVQLPAVENNNILKEGVVDAEKLYGSVLKNNATFIEQGNNKNIYEFFSNEELKNICDIISRVITNKIEELQIDAKYVDYNLSNLKIFKFNGYVYATVTREGCLAVNVKMIDTLKVENPLEKILTHESMHLIQKSSDNNVIGVNYRSDGLQVNSLYNTWFIETSAELAASQINGEVITYKNEMKYLETLIIATAFEMQKVENLNFSYDLDELYRMFDCEGLISKEETAIMLFAIDVILNENKEFFDNYETNKDGRLNSAEIQSLKRSYAASVYTTLAKKLYHDLAQTEMTLQEIFSFIELFETSCSDILWYDDMSRWEENKEFVSKYTMMQGEYFKILAGLLGISAEEITELYNCYNRSMDVVIDNNEKDEQLNEIYMKMRHNKGEAVNVIFKDKL